MCFDAHPGSPKRNSRTAVFLFEEGRSTLPRAFSIYKFIVFIAAKGGRMERESVVQLCLKRTCFTLEILAKRDPTHFAAKDRGAEDLSNRYL